MIYKETVPAVRVGILTGYGINADRELARAFIQSGGTPEIIHVNDVIADPHRLDNYQILCFPGGFSFGDHISSGLVFANLCKKHLRRHLDAFRDDGKLIMGICNGFQVLVKMGILPNIGGNWDQEVSLVHNDSGLFIDRWVETTVAGNALWTRGISELDLPVRHGEGKFIVRDAEILDHLESRRLAVLRYRPHSNPNGSVHDIAGITDPTGRVFGLMPHPEAFLIPQNHPSWHRRMPAGPLGVGIIENAVEYMKNSPKSPEI